MWLLLKITFRMVWCWLYWTVNHLKMGKHKLMMSSEQMFFTPFKKIKDSNPVNSASDQTEGERLHPQEHLDHNAKTRVSCTTSTQTTAPRSCVFPANYTLHVGKSTTKVMQKSKSLALSPSCLFPSEKHDKKIEISVSSHSFNSERKKDEKLVKTKALCRREYATSRQKQSGSLLNGSKTTKTKQISQVWRKNVKIRFMYWFISFIS